MEEHKDSNQAVNDPAPNPAVHQPQINGQPQAAATYQQQQQQQYAAYIQQQRYIAMQQHQQYIMQQRYMAQYIAQQKQIQQQQYTQYYQQIHQQYGYSAMIQAMKQNNHINQPPAPPQTSGGQIILSADEQPLLLEAAKNANRRRKGRKRKKPYSDHEDFDEDDFILKLGENGFDEYTLINKDERLPDHDTEFDEWLHFSKQLWKRQRKYKHCVLTREEKELLELEESLSCGQDMTLSPTSSGTLPFRSSFLRGICLFAL